MGPCKGFDRKKISHDTRGLESLEAVKMAQEDTGSERVKAHRGDTSKLSSLNHLYHFNTELFILHHASWI